MSYLHGVTTWGALLQKLSDLITGATADDFAVTAAAGDRWQKPTADEFIFCPPASQGWGLSQEHRAGYYLRIDDCCFYTDGTSRAATFCRATAALSAFHANFNEILTVQIKVATANSTPGNYSTAVLNIALFSTNAAGTYTALIGKTTTVTVAADGSWTYNYVSGTTVPITGQVGDPSGTLAAGAYFVRHFTNVHRGGIDYWRGFEKAPGGASFAVAPPGVAGTDYDVLGYGTYVPPTLGAPSATYCLNPRDSYVWPQRGYSAGLGIKTTAGLTGDRYVVQFTVYDALFRVALGTNTLTLGWGGWGTDLATGRRYGAGGWGDGTTLTPWLQPWTGTPLAATNVQYWISVTPTHLAIVLNGDTTITGGTLTANYLAKITPDDPSGDARSAWMVQRISTTDYNKIPYRWGQHYLFNRLDQLGAGFRDGGRDWQTGSGRNDFWTAVGWNYYGDSGTGNVLGQASTAYAGFCVTNAGDSSWANQYQALPTSIDRTYLPGPDSRWQFTGISIADGDIRSVTEAAYNAGRNRQRGWVAEGLLSTPTGNFNSGDELTDVVTGDKYMLFSATIAYAPFAAGFALKEE